MKQSIIVVLIIACLFLSLTPYEKTQKQKLIDAFEIYVNTLSEEDLECFNTYKISGDKTLGGETPYLNYYIKSKPKSYIENIDREDFNKIRDTKKNFEFADRWHYTYV